MIVALFMPVFFGLAGLSTNLAVLADPSMLALSVGLIVIASVGKFSGAFVGGAIGGLSWREAWLYTMAQVVGALVGVAVADAMFGEPIYSWSRHVRAGFPQALSEVVATFGLLSVIWGCARNRPTAVPFAVGAYITAAYWFTASTSFANPAVTIARSLTDTFTGIRPIDVPAFLVSQALGASAATALFRWLVPALPTVADHVVVPRELRGPTTRI